MSTDQPDIAKIQRAVTTALHEHWVSFLVEGVVLVVLGATAVVIPPLATLAVTIILGWLFLVSGAMGLVTTFGMRQAPGFWWSLLSAALGVTVGILLLARPISGASRSPSCWSPSSSSRAPPRSCSRSTTDASCPAIGAGCW